MTKDDLIIIRPYQPDDKNLIMSTFLIGLYYGKSPFSEMKKHTFMKKYHSVIEGILALPTTVVRMACLKEDPSVLLGYSILTGAEHKSLAWVFVKPPWRGIGIAKDLVPETIKTFSHYTKVGLIISKKKDLAYDPFIV